ncbi:MAG TPA: SRPBCC family protein [Mycobacteriales bacterium]|nr:SRPBCC family protein [Mycobacteriales bacterium]
MPTYRVATDIDAEPAVAFAAIADLSGHAAWAADPIEVTAADSSPIAPGKRYRSTATSKGKTFTADLVVTEYDAPRRFAFTATDATGCYHHRFTVSPAGAGVRVEREISGDLTLPQRLLFTLVYLPVKRPSARRAMAQLQAVVEKTR